MKTYIRGDQIVYIPDHAKNDPGHPDIEYGFVTDMTPNNKGAFCRYFRKGNINQLRTTANSESTPLRNLRKVYIHSSYFIKTLLKELGYE